MGDVAQEILKSRIGIRADESVERVKTDHAALLGDRAYQFVCQIAGMGTEPARIGVRGDNRRGANLQHVCDAPGVQVRDVDHHPEPVHLLDDRDPVVGQPRIRARSSHRRGVAVAASAELAA